MYTTKPYNFCLKHFFLKCSVSDKSVRVVSDICIIICNDLYIIIYIAEQFFLIFSNLTFCKKNKNYPFNYFLFSHYYYFFCIKQ